MLQIKLTDANGVNTVLVTGPHISIGTAPGCQLRIDAADVSPCHATLQYKHDRWVLRDLQSRTGTWLGQTRISRMGSTVEPGQSIRIGMAELEFESPELPASLSFPQASTAVTGDYSRMLRQCQNGDEAAAAVLYREALRRGDPATTAWAIPFAVPGHTAWAALTLALNEWPRAQCTEIVEHVAEVLASRSWPHRMLMAPVEWWGNVRHGVAEPRMLLARHLFLGAEDAADTRLSEYLASEWLRNVTIVTVRSTGAPKLLPALSESALLGLETLDLAGFPIRTSQLPELVTILERLSGLQQLVLRGCGLTDEGVRQLVRMSQLKQLTLLDLSDNALGDDAAIALARSANVVNLQRLDLRGHQFSLDGIRRLRMSVRFQEGALLYD